MSFEPADPEAKGSPPPTQLDRPMREHFALRIVLAPVRVLVASVIILDELVWPLWRPLVDRIVAMAPIRRAMAWIAGLPPYVVLIILAVPFIGVEPLKLIALVWMASGRIFAGIVLLAVSYAGSFLLVDGIYRAGRERLMEIGWFRTVMGALDRFRRSLLERVRATAFFKFAARLARDVRERAAQMVLQIRRAVGRT